MEKTNGIVTVIMVHAIADMPKNVTAMVIMVLAIKNMLVLSLVNQLTMELVSNILRIKIKERKLFIFNVES